MFQVIEQTDKQKLKMYMKLKKKDLAKMLIQCNKILNSRNEMYQFDMAKIATTATNSNVGIGQNTPTAYLHIKHGTATASTLTHN